MITHKFEMHLHSVYTVEDKKESESIVYYNDKNRLPEKKEDFKNSFWGK